MKQTAGSGGEKAIDWTGVFAGEMKGGLRMEINTGSIFRILKTHRKSILIFSLFALMAAGLGVKGRMEAQDLAGKAVRAAEGGSTQSRTFTFRLENSDQQELAVDIAPVEPVGGLLSGRECFPGGDSDRSDTAGRIVRRTGTGLL